MLSTLPAHGQTAWDDPLSCSRVFPMPEGRYAYAEGTSFSAPIVSGIAALVWQVEPRLASEQVAEVLTRSARQTIASGWNEFTGAGVVDGAAATALARRFDVTAPVPRGQARRVGDTVRVRIRKSPTAPRQGRELAGGIRYRLIVSRNGGRSFDCPHPRAGGSRSRGTCACAGRAPTCCVASACDRNGNCGIKRLGRFRP